MSEDTKMVLNAIARLQEEQASFQMFVAGKFDTLDKKVDTLDKKVDTLDKKITQTNVLLENEIRPAIKSLAEGQSALQSTQQAMQIQLDRIEEQVTTHDIQISVLDRRKKKAK